MNTFEVCVYMCRIGMETYVEKLKAILTVSTSKSHKNLLRRAGFAKKGILKKSASAVKALLRI